MAKTPTTERETATFRLPATLLNRARQEGAQRGLAYVRSVEEALEVYFFSRLPPLFDPALRSGSAFVVDWVAHASRPDR